MELRSAILFVVLLFPESQVSSPAREEYAAGSRAFEQRDYQQAQQHFQQVTRLAPEWAPGWKALGVTLACKMTSTRPSPRCAKLASSLPLNRTLATIWDAVCT